MRTTHILPLITAVGIAMACNALHAQIREPLMLPNLVWDSGGTQKGHDMMWTDIATHTNPTSLIQDFEIGWNWTSLPWNVGRFINGRRYHSNDFRYHAETTVRDLTDMQTALDREGLPNMQLVPCVKGVGQSESVYGPGLPNSNKEVEGSNPSEAVAMEFVPWLQWDSTTKKFTRILGDSTGSVFGWKIRRRGTDINDSGYYRRRYTRQAAGSQKSSDPILEAAAPDDQLRAWTPDNTSYGEPLYKNQNTRVMELAVTLRRTEDDADVPNGNDTDSIMTIQLQYALGENPFGSQFIRLSAAPTDTVKRETHNDLHHGLLARTIKGSIAPSDPHKFVITRRMLPQMSDSSEVTIIATFLCDGNAGNNPKIRDEKGKTANSTEIGRIGITVWHNDDPSHGLGIELRNIRLQTPVAGDLFTGKHDERIQHSANRFLEDLRTMQDTIQAHVSSPRTAPSYKVWMFYGRDEGPKCYWKSYRYINKLLGGRLMTEVNIEDADEFLHATKFNVLWQGATPTTSPHIASYASTRGFRDSVQKYDSMTNLPNKDSICDSIRKAYCNIRFGMRDMILDSTGGTAHYLDDPDTFQEWGDTHTVGGKTITDSLPVPTNRIDHVLQLATRNENCGILANLEQTMVLDFLQNHEMLFGKVPWLSQVWINYHMGIRGREPHQHAWFLNNRPRTVGEARLALWMPLILGAKGLMFYRGTTSRASTGDPLPTNPNSLSVPPGVPADDFESGLLGYFLPNSLLQASPPIDSAWMRGESAGSDWLKIGDPSHVPAYFYPSFSAVAANLRDTVGNTSTDSIYTGIYTTRNVALDVLERLQNMRTKLGKGTNGRQESDPHILTTLRLESWYGHGFSTISQFRDTADRLPTFIDIGNIATRLRTRHPYRNIDVLSAAGIPGHVNYEPHDSSFYDITMMSLAEDRTMNTSCVISVFNRRTDPRMLPVSSSPGIYTYKNQSTVAWAFAGYKQWADRGAAGRFDQRGARQITIPFNYKHTDQRYRLLRLQEMGGGIDTIVGQDRELAINFLPGEGKMFRVTVLPGEKPHDFNGWLAHNTQRKAVVYPTLATSADTSPNPVYDYSDIVHPICGMPVSDTVTRVWRAREGDGFRYHVVYHMRAGDNAQMPLKVYYRRSTLLNATPNAASATDSGGIYNPNIVWEAPIALDLFNPSDLATLGPSTNCGYPSIVVRDDPSLPPAMNPCVYVVYECQNSDPYDIAICEAMFSANTLSAAAQHMSYTNAKTTVLALARSNLACPAENNDRLRYWGSPVIGATLHGNYYAWSDYGQGIVVGFKPPTARTFTGELQQLKFDNGQTIMAQYPSLPSYTKMALGEDDIPLVWQEGVLGMNAGAQSCSEGQHIMYTRLFHSGQDVQHHLVARGTLDSTGSLFPRRNEIMRISDVGTNAMYVFNRKPTIFRQMSEYADNAMTTANSFRQLGYANHKADRIAWEHAETAGSAHNNEGTPVAMSLFNFRWRISRMFVDSWDSCAIDYERTRILHSAQSSIYDSAADLRNPELIQGEQKTEVHIDATNYQSADSWAFGDTSVVLSFNSENANYAPGDTLPKVYHMTFAGGYYRDTSVIMRQSNGLGWAALNVTMLNQDGLGQGERMPHVAARHSIVYSPSLLKNRRFSEATMMAWTDNNLTYVPAPAVDRSARGFFKTVDPSLIPGDRIWRGYRAELCEALLADIYIDGIPHSLQLSSREPATRMQSEWFDGGELVDIEFKTHTSGASATMAHAYLERQSDRHTTDLPVLGVQGQIIGQQQAPLHYAFSVLTDSAEKYRVVLSIDDSDGLPAEDVEMAVHNKPFARSSITNEAKYLGVIDGHVMRLIADTTASASLQVWPNPARDEVTILCRVPASRRTLPHLTLDVCNLAGERVATCIASASSKGLLAATMSVENLPDGFYSIAARNRFPIHGMMIVRH